MAVGRLLAVVWAAALAAVSVAFLPGIAPVDYHEGSPLEVFANKLQSRKNKLPHQYFYAYPFCRPASGASSHHQASSSSLNLGQLLMGERHELTRLDFRMLQDASCVSMCEGQFGRQMTGPLRRLNAALVIKLMQLLIDDEYVVRLNVDSLPAVVRVTARRGDEAVNTTSIGYPYGVELDGQYFIHNHFDFTVYYHEPLSSRMAAPAPGGRRPLLGDVSRRESAPSAAGGGEGGAEGGDMRDIAEVAAAEAEAAPKEHAPERVYRVVGFEVHPFSMGRSQAGRCAFTAEGKPEAPQPLNMEHIEFTYDVRFVPSKVRWATRWDSVLSATPEQRNIQWFSVINSMFLTFFLTLMVGLIMLKSVNNDFARYNRLSARRDDSGSDLLDESGWKLVHGDVFRAPPHAELLCIFCGIGAQLLWTFFATLSIAIFGFFTPEHRGRLLTVTVLLWVCLSSAGGYVSASLYKTLGGQRHRAVALGSAFLYSSTVFGVFFVMNLLLWSQKSTGAVPFGTLLLLLALWFGLSVPLVLLGARMGFAARVKEWPCKTNLIAREVPASTFRWSTPMHCVLAGLVPFGVLFVQLLVILHSLWQDQLYYMFGFLYIVFVLTVIASAEVSVVFTYLKLATEDYRWWWYSFVNCAFTGVYVFFYTAFFFFHQTDVLRGHHLSSALLFLSYNALLSLSFAMTIGFVGFYASLIFTRRLYSSIRID